MNRNFLFLAFLIINSHCVLVFSFTKTLSKTIDQATQTKMTNIGYLSYTYDIYYGNPQPTQGFDPGSRNYPIYNFLYNKKTTTSDGRYLIPDNIVGIGEQVCNLDFSSSSITGTNSYTNSLQVSVSVTGGFGAASFSASAYYKSVEQGTQSSSNIYITNSENGCEIRIYFEDHLLLLDQDAITWNKGNSRSFLFSPRENRDLSNDQCSKDPGIHI